MLSIGKFFNSSMILGSTNLMLEWRIIGLFEVVFCFEKQEVNGIFNPFIVVLLNEESAVEHDAFLS